MASDYRALHDQENQELSTYLHSLSDDDWEKPSLCTGWRVRDVIGHILYGNEMNWALLPFRMARYGFSSDRSGAVYSRKRAEGLTPQQLLADFDNRDPWAGTCRVFPDRMVMLDRLVHHQDVRRALGHPRVIPADRLRACLDVTPPLGFVFGAKRRVKGLRLEASDVDWSHGSGPLVRGPGEALVMAMLGRGHAVADLEGDGVPTFAARMSPPVSA